MALQVVWRGTSVAALAARTRRAQPLLVSLCGLAAVVFVAAALKYKPWDPAIWSRWDSGLYEDIARRGYSLFPCSYDRTKWCGNAAWFPGYPWIFGGLHRFGLPLRWTAVVASWLFATGSVLLLWATFLQRRRDGAVIAALLFAAFAPGQIYLYSIFPLSMLVFASVASLWLLQQGRYLLAGVAGAVAALAYPVGVLLAPIAGVWIAAQLDIALRDRLRRLSLALAPIATGLMVMVVDQRVETGHWNAFFLVQEKYAGQRSSGNPFVSLWDIVRAGVRHFSDGVVVVVALQTLFVTLLLLLLLVHGWRRRRSLPRGDMLLLLWALPTWLLPLSQSISVQRGQAALLPLAALVARLPARLVWSLALAAAAIGLWMETYFLDWTLR